MKTARQAKRRGTTRPPYARELHDIAVRALRAGRLPAELAREIGVPTTTLRAWLRAADLAAAGSRHTRTEVLGRTIREYAHLDQRSHGCRRAISLCVYRSIVPLAIVGPSST